MPAASASPPPNIMITPHGARSASAQLSSGRPVPSGRTNSNRPTNTAMVPSVNAPSGSNAAQQRLRHPQHEGERDERHEALFGHRPRRVIVDRLARGAHVERVRGDLLDLADDPARPAARRRIRPAGRTCVHSAKLMSNADGLVEQRDGDGIGRAADDRAKAANRRRRRRFPSAGRPTAPPSILRSSPPPASTASAIGIMMRLVEVLEIAIDRIAEASMKASSSCVAPPFSPSRLRMPSARRRCSPVRSMASARKAPPRIRKRMGE